MYILALQAALPCKPSACEIKQRILLADADEELEEVKSSSSAKTAAKPTKKPVLPDSVRAIAKVCLLCLSYSAHKSQVPAPWVKQCGHPLQAQPFRLYQKCDAQTV